VLYVEDDALLRDATARLLQRVVNTLHVAANGQEGWELFESCRPDIVVTDLRMPLMDGLALAARIKQHAPKTPVVMYTAFNDVAEMRRAIDIGIDKYVNKPIPSFKSLIEPLESVALKVEAEQQQLHKFKQIVEQSPNNIHILDAGGVIVESSETFAASLGYTHEEIIGMHVSQWDARIENLPLKLNALFEDAHTFITRHRRKDGTEFDVEILSTTIEIGNEQLLYASSVDVSERLRAEKKERIYKEVMDHAASKIAFIDDQYRYQTVNHRYASLFGRQPEEVTGLHLREVLGDAMFETLVKPHIDKALEGKEVSFETEVNDKFLYARYVPYAETGASKPSGVIVSLLNITERVLAERKEKEHAAILVRQNRLALQGEMLNMIAHQWRQPLNDINLMRQLLFRKINRGRLDKQTAARLDAEMEGMIEHLTQTIRDFRDFFKQDKQGVSFPVGELVHETLRLAGKRLEKNGIGVTVDMPAELMLHTQKKELGQVLLAIYNNAIDAFDEGYSSQKHLHCSARTTRHGVELQVSDTAGGIAAEEITQVFEPYYSTKSEKNGTGLGLYMAKMIVDQSLGGQIEARNEKEGACFVITIPTRRDRDSA
jgi:PAS domain S-box-containing protein